jgi:hypothetical protein
MNSRTSHFGISFAYPAERPNLLAADHRPRRRLVNFKIGQIVCYEKRTIMGTVESESEWTVPALRKSESDEQNFIASATPEEAEVLCHQGCKMMP